MSSAAADAPAEAPLNAYEMERAERIKRNKQARDHAAALHACDEAAADLATHADTHGCVCLALQVMAALGLFDEHVAFAAQMRNGGAAPAADDGRQRPGKAKGRKRAATDAPADVDADAATREPPRRSRRVAGLVRAARGRRRRAHRSAPPRLPAMCARLTTRGAARVQETELKGHELPSENGDGAGDVDALHEAGAWAHRQRGLRLFGTASYQHTVMRCVCIALLTPFRLARTSADAAVCDQCRSQSVRTMDEKALARRMTVIERAKGRHAVVKMRLFARVLFLEARPFATPTWPARMAAPMGSRVRRAPAGLRATGRGRDCGAAAAHRRPGRRRQRRGRGGGGGVTERAQ